ncbi:glucokinase [Rubrivivax albus]|uniref:glucokinase n=1 Tax=Rubrivivax albus TaxID=2499835 RepID=UPI001E2E901A|nr:glucokinase [Rubrivivax albus]
MPQQAACRPDPDTPLTEPGGSRAPAGAGLALPWLVADVGGTNARFGWVVSPARGVEHVRRFPVAGSAGPAEAVRAYLAGLPADVAAAPRRAAIAVATAVRGDRVELTNSPWAFSCAELQTDLGLASLQVLNDFEALALSLPRLRPTQWRAHGAAPVAAGTLAVIGPGTGLGVGGVVQTEAGWVALPGEGGHATLAPSDDLESEVLRHARGQWPHVSAERLLSGIGLPLLHTCVAQAEGRAPEALSAEQVVERGVAGDAACARTLDVFCALLGGFAGNVALTLGARAVFIGGGIVPRLGDRFFTSPFRARFEAKGRFSDYLAAVPTALITDTLAALAGAAFAIEQRHG